MGLISIVAYRAKPGQEVELQRELEGRLPLLRRLGLATQRPEILMRSRSGALVQVSEWASQEAIDTAHKTPEVLAMWERFGACCEFGPLSALPECGEMFATFRAV